MLHKLSLLTVAIFLTSWLSTAFAQVNPCTPGINPDAPNPCENIGFDNSKLGGVAGDILSAIDLVQNFSLEGLLTGVCGAGGKAPEETSGVQGVVCDIADTYQNVTFLTENYDQVLTGWGKNLATDFLQYDLGLGSHLTRDELAVFSDRLEAAILNPEDSGNEIASVVGDIALEKLDQEAQNAANAPAGTPERKLQDTLLNNPLLARANKLLGIEKADNIVAQGRSIANAVESGNIAEKVLESETMLNVDKEFRKFVPEAKKAINLAPSTRAGMNQLVQDLLSQSELLSTGLTNLGEGIKIQALTATYNTNELTAMHQTMLEEQLRGITDKQTQIKQQVNSYLDNTDTAIGTLESMGSTMVTQAKAKAFPISRELFNY